MEVIEKINIAPCPDCGHNIDLGPQPKKGQSVTCPECWAYLEIVDLEPGGRSGDGNAGLASHVAVGMAFLDRSQPFPGSATRPRKSIIRLGSRSADESTGR